MISDDHHKSIMANNEKLLKANTQLNAQLIQLKADHEQFKKDTLVKLESTIKIYDNSNERVMRYLDDYVGIPENHKRMIMNMYPMKLG